MPTTTSNTEKPTTMKKEKQKWICLTGCFAILCMMGLIVMSGCATSEAARAAKAEQLALTKAKIEEGLANRQYTIDIERAQPLAPAGVINLTSSYSVTVAGDTLKSDLPFFGRAYNIPYGGGKGLRFQAPITNYYVDSTHRNRHIIYIDAVDTEDTYLYIITLFEGGTASVSVTPRQRSHIDFSGKFRVE